MKHTTNFKEFIKLNEEGGAAGGSSATTGGGGGSMGAGAAVGSGDGGSGVAYFNQGNIDGMGDIKNATVSPTPGDPDGSTAGSGDASAYLPAFTFTKNTGITGNKFHKSGKVKVNMGEINRVKDELGVGKTKSFKDFINN